jgi:peroxiredoxin
MGTVALTGSPGAGGPGAVARHRVPDPPERCGCRRTDNALAGRRGALGPRILLLGLLVLAGCDSQLGRAEERDQDPFARLNLARVTPPTPAPDFTVPGLTGGPLRLADFRGRVVLLNFWATWCPPCREEMPSMERLYQRYRERGFTILALSVDRNVAAIPGFVDGFRLTFPIGLDPDGAVAKAYRMRALPTTIVIDRAGQVVAGAAGARDWDSPAAHAVVEALLG